MTEIRREIIKNYRKSPGNSQPSDCDSATCSTPKPVIDQNPQNSEAWNVTQVRAAPSVCALIASSGQATPATPRK